MRGLEYELDFVTNRAGRDIQVLPQPGHIPVLCMKGNLNTAAQARAPDRALRIACHRGSILNTI